MKKLNTKQTLFTCLLVTLLASSSLVAGKHPNEPVEPSLLGRMPAGVSKSTRAPAPANAARLAQVRASMEQLAQEQQTRSATVGSTGRTMEEIGGLARQTIFVTCDRITKVFAALEGLEHAAIARPLSDGTLAEIIALRPQIAQMSEKLLKDAESLRCVYPLIADHAQRWHKELLWRMDNLDRLFPS